MADSEWEAVGAAALLLAHIFVKKPLFFCVKGIYFSLCAFEINKDGADKLSSAPLTKFLDLPLLSVQQLPLAFCTEVIRDGPGLIGPSRYLGSTQCHQNAIHITCRLPRVLVKVLGQLSSRKLLVSGSPNSHAT